MNITAARVEWLLLVACWGHCPVAASAPASIGPTWPQFRGPNGSGVAELAGPPLKISPTNNVLWTAEVPWSPSSPCVWNDRLFLTVFADDLLQTRCYDRLSGKLLWSKGVSAKTLELFHKTENSPASATVACDGHHVISYFASFGLICHDLEGRERWRLPLPVGLSGGGFGSGISPIIAHKLALVNRDEDTNSSLLAVDVDTGKRAWETPRPGANMSFGTPILWTNEGSEQVVVAGSIEIKAYDLMSGREDWLVRGTPSCACTSPVVGDGLLFFAAWSPGKSDAPWPSWDSFLAQFDQNKDGAITFEEFPESDRDFMRGLDADHDGRITKSDWEAIMARNAKGQNCILAIRPGGHGDVTETQVAWKFDRGLPYVASPLFYQGRVYLIRDGGMLSSFDAKTGKPYYLQERLDAGGSYYSSPVAAAGRIYLASTAGKVTIVKAGGDKPEILHQADFGERIFATPALAGNQLYLRTYKRLYALGEQSVAEK